MAFSPKTSSGHVTNKGKENGDVLFFVLLYYIFFRECDKRVTHCIFHVHWVHLTFISISSSSVQSCSSPKNSPESWIGLTICLCLCHGVIIMFMNIYTVSFTAVVLSLCDACIHGVIDYDVIRCYGDLWLLPWWRVCSLKHADPAQRASFPHFGPKFRYSGRTQHEARGSTEAGQRTIPKINRKASTRFIGAKEQGYNVGSKIHYYCYSVTLLLV